MDYVKLSNGMVLPKVGLGTFDLKAGSIAMGLEAGYRLLDTAWQYRNEAEVGKAIRDSKIDREQVFVTTKLWTDDIRKDRVREEFEESLKNLQLDYIDLYLIHWPATGFERAWEIMADLKEEGKIKAIGVSNFNEHHFEELKRVSDIVPVINQVESHPYFHNDELISYCRNLNICVQAWCPLGGSYSRLKENDLFGELANQYHKTAAQIILRWHLQRDMMIIPRSSNEKRLKENLEVFDFTLSDSDMQRIDSLNTSRRMGANPDTFQF